MNNKKGFTLMEILLAAMIIGVIGIALAALTTAAVREGGVGRTKMMLRQQLSLALHQLQQDIKQSDAVTVSGTGLQLQQQHSLGVGHTSGRTITYAFTAGAVLGAGGGTTGGTITRRVGGGPNQVWLNNVKQITASGFVSPQFALIHEGTVHAVNSMLRVRIIVEMPTDPVVNDVIDEVFMLPQGFAVQNSL